MIEAIGLALAGRPGARLAARLGLTVERDTLLRRVRALADPATAVVTALGVDDFALRSHDYGTVLVDMDSHQPVDLLPGRAAEPFADWLTAHPGVTVICRDRAGAYALGASTGAPDAVQVADRYHLWANLGEAVSKTVTAHRTALRDASSDPGPQTATSPDDRTDADGANDGTAAVEADTLVVPPVTPVPAVVTVVPDKAIVVRTRERYAEVHALLAAGASRNQVARTLGLDIQTVRRFADGATVEEVLTASLDRESKIDAFKEHLHRRWNEGITSATTLTDEICAQGYTGSVQTVRRYLRRFRGGQPAPAPGTTPPTVRQTSRWLMTRPDRLDPDDRTSLQAILDRCPDLARLGRPRHRLRRHDDPAARPAAARLDRRRRGRHPHAPGLVRPAPAQRPRRTRVLAAPRGEHPGDPRKRSAPRGGRVGEPPRPVAVAGSAATPEPVSCTPGPFRTESRCAPTTTTRCGSPSGSVRSGMGRRDGWPAGRAVRRRLTLMRPRWAAPPSSSRGGRTRAGGAASRPGTRPLRPAGTARRPRRARRGARAGTPAAG